MLLLGSLYYLLPVHKEIGEKKKRVINLTTQCCVMSITKPFS